VPNVKTSTQPTVLLVSTCDLVVEKGGKFHFVAEPVDLASNGESAEFPKTGEIDGEASVWLGAAVEMPVPIPENPRKRYCFRHLDTPWREPYLACRLVSHLINSYHSRIF
jgi:hypothetical protein